MPLERKILLTILISIILIFSSYFLYTGYYLEHKKNIKKIINYEKLISNFTPDVSNITSEDIDELLNREDILKNYFTEMSNMENLTSHIKSLLLRNGITISQFNPGEKTVRFSITGTKYQLRQFLYALTKESLSIYIPMFSIRIVDNENISGIIEVSENIISKEPQKAYINDSLRKLFRQTTYRGSLLSNLGIDLYPEPEAEAIIIEEAVPEVKIIPTEKFRFVGILKNQNQIITLFKDKYNGRIYRFENGETISKWTFIGKADKSYIFEKDEIKYEVKD